MVEFLEDAERVFWALHMLGLAFGIGGGTMTDLMFFRFLKNYHIDEWEANTVGLLSYLIWVGVALLLVSGIALYIPQATELNESPLFLTKMVAVLVVIINGALLTFWMEPQMGRISFLKEEEKKDEAIHPVRRRAFMLGSISFISWYGSFVLAAMEAAPLSLPWLLGVFLFLLCGGIIVSQIVERYMEAKAPRSEKDL